jgi:hypothetical protein
MAHFEGTPRTTLNVQVRNQKHEPMKQLVTDKK